jgi:hypothetical protein
MNLVICTDYDPRFSNVASTVSRWSKALPALTDQDVVPVVVSLIDGSGTANQNVSPTYGLEVSLVLATGAELATVTPGQTQTTVTGTWAFTLPLNAHSSTITQPTEAQLEVILVATGLRDTIMRQNLTVLSTITAT